MNIDWSKAPEGADRYYPEDPEMGWSESWGKGDKIWHLSCWFDPIHFGGLHKKRLNSCIMRPINSDQQWTGEGLPPVGMVCECMCTAKGKERDWFVARVNYMSEHTAVLDSLVDCAELGEFVAHPGTMKFRPLRTPEQIAEEERRSEFYKACEEINSKVNFTNEPLRGSILAAVVLAMIDAGYRKQEQTK